MRKTTLAVVGALLFTGALNAATVSGEHRPSGGTTMLRGTVTDAEDSPLEGVAVKLFDEGLLVDATITDESGSYAIELAIDPGLDSTILVWWVAPRTDLVSEVAIIRESDRDLGLWGPCVPRVRVADPEPWNVKIRDRGSFLENLIRSGCALATQVRPGTGKW